MRLSAIWHQSLDEAAEALESEQIETEGFYMDHAMRLRFDASLAAVQEYRRRMSDPDRRFASLLTAPVAQARSGPLCLPRSFNRQRRRRRRPPLIPPGRR